MEQEVRELCDRLEAEVRATKRQARLMFAVTVTAVGVAISLAVVKPVQTQEQGTTLKAPVTIVDGAGKKLMTVDSVASRCILTVFNAQGKFAAMLDAGGHGKIGNQAGGSFSLWCSEPNFPVVQLGIAANSAPLSGGSFRLSNTNGEPVAQLFGGENGTIFTLQNKDGKTAAALHGRENGGSFFLLGADGKTVFRKP